MVCQFGDSFFSSGCAWLESEIGIVYGLKFVHFYYNLLSYYYTLLPIDGDACDGHEKRK